MERKKQYPVVDNRICGGCAICVESCPRDCLELVPLVSDPIHAAARLMQKSRCVGCGICAKVCPIWAIEMKEGV